MVLIMWRIQAGAIEGLVVVEKPEAGDKTALNDLIAQYSGLNAKDYTAAVSYTHLDVYKRQEELPFS